MKDWKSSVRPVVIVFLCFAFSGIRAQQWADNSSSSSATANFNYYFPGDNFTSNVPMNEIKPSAFRRFTKEFPQAVSSHWKKTKSGYCVSFNEGDSIAYRISFNVKGEPVKQYVSYSGPHAPADIKEIINDRYPGYFIDVVSEFSDNLNNTYVIVIMYGNSAKSLQLHNGKLDLVKQFQNPDLANHIAAAALSGYYE